MSLFRARYGAHPLHLLALIACFAIAGYAATRVFVSGGWLAIGIWFVCCVIGHDLVLWPLYALADSTMLRLSRRRRPGRLPAVPWTNYLRVPIWLSGLLLVVYFPSILRLARGEYEGSLGLSVDVYLGRWLLVTGVFFVGSAVLYAVRLGRVRRGRSG